MKIRIEFYRTRDADAAHAVVGTETAEAQDREDAIRIARQFSLSLDMPQRADAVTITGADGATIYSGALEAG
jgi:hypothetical protein